MADQTFDPSKPFEPAAAAPTFDPSKPFERAPDFKATNEPPSLALKGEAWGKDLAKMMLDALPGAGAVVGGALATPETAGAGTVAAAALGAGIGRGLRDIIAAGLGVEKPSTIGQQSARIGTDVAETYVAGKVLPALWEAIKSPGATIGEVYDGMRTLRSNLPLALRAFLPEMPALPSGVAKAPASILQRPAWQTWADVLPEDTAPPATGATSTGAVVAAPRPATATSMVPGVVPASQPGTATIQTPAAAPAPAVPASAAPAAANAAAAPAPAAPFYPQKTLNELAILARRGKIPQLTGQEYQQGLDLVKAGATPQQALEKVIAARAGSVPTFGVGLPTDAEVAARVAERNRTGRWPK